jgi:hypothetical protein
LDTILNALPGFLFAFLPFIVFWVVIVKLIARTGGWRALAASYKAAYPFEGTKFRFQSARLRRKMSYNNVLTVGANRDGIYLKMSFIFRIGHPPLFIPWEDVSVSTARVMWTTTIKLEFAKCPKVPLMIRKRLAKKLEDASGMILTEEQST